VTAAVFLLASHPVLWVPAGSWAEWLGAVGTVGAIGWGVIAWGRDRRRALDLDESAHARLVGAYTLDGGLKPVLVNLINNSRFPVAKVEVVLIGGGYRHVVWGGDPATTMVLVPNDAPQTEIVQPPPNVRWRLEMAFTDDNGTRWYKDGSNPLRKVPPDFSLVGESA
jgi:hypothetical protein